MSTIKRYQSHGNGKFTPAEFNLIGDNVIFEAGVLVFHPENIILGSNIYIGHNTILKGYYQSLMEIGTDTWIGQGCFFHSAGGLKIGNAVGIGPMVKILTSHHDDQYPELAVLELPLKFEPVVIEDGADIGTGTVILPGVTIGRNSIIGAGSVVTRDVQPSSIYTGVPAKFLRMRNQ